MTLGTLGASVSVQDARSAERVSAKRMTDRHLLNRGAERPAPCGSWAGLLAGGQGLFCFRVGYESAGAQGLRAVRGGQG